MRKITLLNGPNLNLLGLREPDRYGVGTLAEIVAECSAFSSDNGFDLNSFQSNSEADLINRIHSAIDDKIEGILINPGAYGTHKHWNQRRFFGCWCTLCRGTHHKYICQRRISA